MINHDKKWIVQKLTPMQVIPVLRIFFGLLFIFSKATNVIDVSTFQEAMRYNDE